MKKVIWCRWVDSDADGQEPWKYIKSLDKNLIQIEAIGFVVKETDDMIYLSVSYCHESETAITPLMIPKVAIVDGPYEIEFRR